MSILQTRKMRNLTISFMILLTARGRNSSNLSLALIMTPALPSPEAVAGNRSLKYPQASKA